MGKQGLHILFLDAVNIKKYLSGVSGLPLQEKI
jgi:hypothetical protein